MYLKVANCYNIHINLSAPDIELFERAGNSLVNLKYGSIGQAIFNGHGRREKGETICVECCALYSAYYSYLGLIFEFGQIGLIGVRFVCTFDRSGQQQLNQADQCQDDLQR